MPPTVIVTYDQLFTAYIIMLFRYIIECKLPTTSCNTAGTGVRIV